MTLYRTLVVLAAVLPFGAEAGELGRTAPEARAVRLAATAVDGTPIIEVERTGQPRAAVNGAAAPSEVRRSAPEQRAGPPSQNLVKWCYSRVAFTVGRPTMERNTVLIRNSQVQRLADDCVKNGGRGW